MNSSKKTVRLFTLGNDDLITDMHMGFAFDPVRDNFQVLHDSVKSYQIHKLDQFHIFDLVLKCWIVDDRTLEYVILESVHGLKFLLIQPSNTVPRTPFTFAKGDEPKALLEIRTGQASLSPKTAELVSRITAKLTVSSDLPGDDERVKLRLYARHFFDEIHKLPGYKFKNVQKFDQKLSGDQTGARAYVVYKNDTTGQFETFKFYIKTHQGGTSRFRKAAQTLDPREVFVYKYLEIVGLGARVNFFFDPLNYNNVYVSSQEVEEDFFTFSVDANDSTFLNYFNSNPSYLKGLVWIELLGKILHLADINDNLSNFGFLKTVSSFEDIRVVDFVVYEDYINKREDMLKRFLKPDISLKVKKYLDADTIKLFNISLPQKIDIAKQIMHCKGESLVANLTIAEEETRRFLQESGYRSKLKEENVPIFDAKAEKFEDYLYLVKHQMSQFQDFMRS